jgi:Fe-S-cluster containining protein
MDETKLSYRQALESPCQGCQASCCTFLPLHDFNVTKLSDLDYALYVSNFDRIELSLVNGGKWRVHYRMECRFFEKETRLCGLHESGEKPNVCKRYNPYSCFYKQMFQSPETDNFIRFNRERLEVFASLLTFDENRNITAFPSVDELRSALPPWQEPSDLPPPPDDGLYARSALSSSPDESRSYQASDFRSPCSGCKAWCCTVLCFPHGGPKNLSDMDHLRFCLGFPGVELGIGDSGWSVNVRTRCRHLQRGSDGSGTCGVIGSPQRPNMCSLYDESMCAYSHHFGQVRPNRYMRLRLEHFKALEELVAYDSVGYVVAVPQIAQIRAAVEAV